MPNVELDNPPRAGIVTPFSRVPPVKRHSWSLKNNPEETYAVRRLHRRVRDLAGQDVTLMHVALSRGVQPLQFRAHPMHWYTGENDPRAIRGPFFESKSIQEMLSLLFKGKMTDFPTELSNMGFLASVLVAEPHRSWAADISSPASQPRTRRPHTWRSYGLRTTPGLRRV